MAEFDKERFESLMNTAVGCHVRGEYEQALDFGHMAYQVAPGGTTESGRAARDIGARYDRLHKSEDAKNWLGEAFAIHNHIVEDMEDPTREALRERSVSAMYLGVIGLRRAINLMQHDVPITNPEPIEFMRLTWLDLREAKTKASGINKRIDQYEINATRRISIAETLLGNKKAGLVLGAFAVKRAFMSESPKLDTSNPELETMDRIRAKNKALIGGLAAIAINVLSSPAIKTKKLALKIAERTL
ncbi:MAG TPA: hypothetical protein VII94_01180 [Candidatus Saccharimonadales bacterium]